MGSAADWLDPQVVTIGCARFYSSIVEE